MDWSKYFTKAESLNKAVERVEKKIAEVDWSAEHKIDPNGLHDVRDRLEDRAWENAQEYCSERFAKRKSYTLGEAENGMPIFS